MSYPRDLDEYTEKELNDELILRDARQKVGLCDYCNRQINSEPVCKFPKRHRGGG